MMKFELVGYSIQTCPVCNGTGHDPKYYPGGYAILDYCPRCSGNKTIQISHYAKVEVTPNKKEEGKG